jgi:hypothetical protein
MADTHQASSPSVTALDRLHDLFAGYPFPGRDLVWLVDELISIAQHTGSVAMGVNRTPDGSASCLVCAAPPVLKRQLPLPQVRTGTFRSILARLAQVGSDETGTECNPYGDRFALTRSSRSGPVRLEVAFTNTPAAQELVITRTPVAVTPRAPSATDTPATDPQAQPSA